MVLASANPGKLSEIRALLKPLDVNLLPISQFSNESAPENSLTFVENALSKARFGAQKSQLPALADDSGLIVPALQGKPGVLSARYANNLQNSDDQANRSKLLADMKNLQVEERKAFFICVIVILLYPNDPDPIIACGKWHGSIATEENGEWGFGYDKIFYLPELRQSAAQLKPHKKNMLSHRGIALKLAIDKLKELTLNKTSPYPTANNYPF